MDDQERIREAISRLEATRTEAMAGEARKALEQLGPVKRKIFLRLFARSARKAGIPREVTAEVMRLLKDPPRDPG